MGPHGVEWGRMEYRMGPHGGPHGVEWGRMAGRMGGNGAARSRMRAAKKSHRPVLTPSLPQLLGGCLVVVGAGVGV
jgi:hypothetical protein